MKTYLVVETPVVACLHAATSDGYLCSRCNVCDDMASWCDCVVDHDGVSFYFVVVFSYGWLHYRLYKLIRVRVVVCRFLSVFQCQKKFKKKLKQQMQQRIEARVREISSKVNLPPIIFVFGCTLLLLGIFTSILAKEFFLNYFSVSISNVNVFAVR